MNSEITLLIYRSFLGIILSSLTFSLGAADLEKSRTINEEFTVNDQSIVKLIHGRGDLEVEYYDGAKAMISVNIVARGENEEDLAFLLSKYTLDITQSGSHFDIESNTHIKSWNQINALVFNRTRIRFDDGSSITSDVEDLDAHLTLKIPMIASLSLTNKYHDINVSDIPFDLAIHQFSAAFNAGDITGNLEIDMKYGKVKAGHLKNADLDFFDSKVVFKDVESIILRDKYSNIQMGNVSELEMELFDADVELGNVSGDCNIKDKYSKIAMGQIRNGVWDLFDAKVEFNSGDKLELKSKYSKFEIEDLEELILHSFDDHFEITHLGKLDAEQSKYSNYDIGMLDGTVFMHESFDDKVEVEEVSTGFGGFEIDAKYSHVNLPLQNLNYQIDADVKYGKIQYPRESFETRVHIEENSVLKIQAQKSGATGQLPLIKIRGFDNKIDLH